MAQTVADLDFDPIALLEQELGSNDRSARLRAVKGLPALATACGVEVTRTKILSILAEHVRQEEEDEVQYRIAMARVPPPRDFSALLGGDQHGALLFDLLQSLARIEETMVRAKAVASLSSVFASVDVSSGGAEVGASAVKIVSGMADPGADATGFGAKVSAASVCAAAAALLERCGVDEAVKKELRDVYARICADDAPIVRRAAAHELAAMCEAVAGAEAFDGDLSATAMKLIGDEHDAVRLIAVEQLGRVLGSERCAAAAAKSVPDDGVGGCSKLDLGLGLLSMFAALFDDAEVERRVAALVESTVHDNWRVRAALNGALPAVALARGKDAFEAQLLEGFVRSFQDRISEVRTSAVAVLGELRALKKPDGATGLPTDEALFDGDWLMEKIGKRLSELYLTIPCSQLLANDTDADVRNYVKGAIAAL
ncbi:hypothetical protein JL720_4565 [Aureococcus anophagefferens]|nr:hypothetical protein JL720_4565 [Aureococcus anophagefferens]